MSLNNIKNREELNKIFNIIYKQGFNYINSYNNHTAKIDNIKSKANPLNITGKDYNLHKLYDDDDDYSTITKKLTTYYSQFGTDLKIDEYFNLFYMKADDTGSFPGSSPRRSDSEKWIKFKKKNNIRQDPPDNTRQIYYYNFDKSYIKLNDIDSYSWYKFENLYFYLYNKKPNKIKRHTNKWYDLGEIQVKFFQNGSMNLKGNIESIIQYFLKEKINTINNVILIKYKNKYTYYGTN